MEWFCRSGLSLAKRSGRNSGPFGRSPGLHRLPAALLYALRKVEHEVEDADLHEDEFHEANRLGMFVHTLYFPVSISASECFYHRRRRRLSARHSSRRRQYIDCCSR